MENEPEKRSAFLSKETLDSADFKKSSEEKQRRIENELSALRQRCTSAGLSEAQVRAYAEPFVECARRKDRMGLLNKVIWLSLVTAAFSGALLNQTANDWVVTHLRLFSVKVIRPFWDFTIYYNDQCVIPNPLFDENAGRGELDCSVCNELNGKIEEMTSKDADPKIIFEDFLQSNAPLLVHNALDNWKATQELSMEKLYELYTTDPVLSRTEAVCDVTGASDFDAVLKRLQRPEKTRSMSAVWLNCDKEAYKRFRKFYRRPAFLPPAAEAVHTNLVIVSMGKEKSRTRDGTVIPPGPEGDLATWVAQVKGKLEYTLSPIKDCESQCTKAITVVMEPGDFLLVPLDLWEISFKPLGPNAEDAIAVGSGLMWDVSG